MQDLRGKEIKVGKPATFVANNELRFGTIFKVYQDGGDGNLWVAIEQDSGLAIYTREKDGILILDGYVGGLKIYTARLDNSISFGKL